MAAWPGCKHLQDQLGHPRPSLASCGRPWCGGHQAFLSRSARVCDRDTRPPPFPRAAGRYSTERWWADRQVNKRHPWEGKRPCLWVGPHFPVLVLYFLVVLIGPRDTSQRKQRPEPTHRDHPATATAMQQHFQNRQRGGCSGQVASHVGDPPLPAQSIDALHGWGQEQGVTAGVTTAAGPRLWCESRKLTRKHHHHQTGRAETTESHSYLPKHLAKIK